MSASTSLTASGSNSSAGIASLSDPNAKRYSLVKWLENSQFDSQNEWLGRLTSVPHSSIIDFDADELKAGMELSVVRNNGEIWRAQVIIPKTASNTIDLPPSSGKKIRTKAMSSKNIQNLVDHDTSSSSLDQTSLLDLNDLSSTAVELTTSVPTASNTTTSSSATVATATPILSTLNASNPNQSLIILTANPSSAVISSDSSPTHHINNKQSKLPTNNNTNNSDWLSDFYPEQQQQLPQATSTVIKLNNLTPITLMPAVSSNIVTVSDLNIETILQMQCDLLEQQKELKTIELETMEQLRLLQQNISKLARKFDSFEYTCATHFPTATTNTNSNNSNNNNNNTSTANNNTAGSINGLTNDNLAATNGFKAAKNVFNKLNSSIRLVECELMKDFHQQQQQQSLINTATMSLVPSNGLGPSCTSSSSSSASSSPTTTTVTLTNHGDLNPQLANINNNLNFNNLKPTATTTIVNLLPSSSAHATSAAGTTLALSNTDLTVPTTRNKLRNADGSTNENLQTQTKSNRAQGIQTQMALNRFLRESVKQKLGAEFLIAHAVSDIPAMIMRQIKKEAFEKYLPNDQRPIKAWGLAMASLRCLKRDLVKNKNKQLAAAAASANTTPSPILTTVKFDDKQMEMDCDEKAIESDIIINNNNNNNNNTNNLKTATRRSGINLTVASSLSFIPTRSANTGVTTTRRQINTVNSLTSAK